MKATTIAPNHPRQPHQACVRRTWLLYACVRPSPRRWLEESVRRRRRDFAFFLRRHVRFLSFPFR